MAEDNRQTPAAMAAGLILVVARSQVDALIAIEHLYVLLNESELDVGARLRARATLKGLMGKIVQSRVQIAAIHDQVVSMTRPPIEVSSGR